MALPLSPSVPTLPLTGRGGPVAAWIDPATGLLAALAHDEVAAPRPVALALTVVTGGTERAGDLGGLVYDGTDRVALDGLVADGPPAVTDLGDAREHVVAARQDGWGVELRYRVGRDAPHVAFEVAVRRLDGAAPQIVRDVELDVSVDLDDPADWLLNAPGNGCRADLAVDALVAPLAVYSASDTVGSPGLIALSRRSAPLTVLLWPLCRTELGEIDVEREPSGVRTRIRTELAARLEPGGPAERWGTLHLELAPEAWTTLRDDLGPRKARLGLVAPPDAPAWIRRAHIYEAHVGFSVFADGRRYERYPEVADLLADLPRLHDLGFDVVQLMPRHPYPSYNVAAYDDITTTYGDEDQLRALVAACHDRGMRVLLDVIMHGVVDREVMDATLAGVHAGPYADRLAEGDLDVLSRSAEDVAWSRHIVEYAPYWRAGSPARHPEADAHPEWFMRDGAGTIARRYTKAYDIAHPGWQEHFTRACEELLRRLDVDGLRVDAPTYNNFATWAEGRDARPSYGPLASLDLLRRLRSRLRAIRPDAVVYTEPTGALFRSVADATYNYDEHWLAEALFGEPHPQRERRMTRTAAEVARWLDDRARATATGAAIVHHVDSHDSIWWRLPGAQFKRERFGRDAAVALTVLLGLIDGAFMTFMGAEEGIEDELRRVLGLRRALPELASARTDFAGVAASHPDVLAALRRGDDGGLVVIAINLGREAVAADVTASALAGARELTDVWNGGDRLRPTTSGALHLTFAPLQPRVLRVA